MAVNPSSPRAARRRRRTRFLDTRRTGIAVRRCSAGPSSLSSTTSSVLGRSTAPCRTSASWLVRRDIGRCDGDRSRARLAVRGERRCESASWWIAPRGAMRSSSVGGARAERGRAGHQAFSGCGWSAGAIGIRKAPARRTPRIWPQPSSGPAIQGPAVWPSHRPLRAGAGALSSVPGTRLLSCE